MLISRDEFRWQHLKFRGSQDDVVLCRWQTHRRVATLYLIYKSFLCTFFFGVAYLGARMARESGDCACAGWTRDAVGYFAAFYTTWNTLFCFVAAATSLAFVATRYVRDGDDAAAPIVYRVVYAVALNSSVATAAAYFSFEFDARHPYVGVSYVSHLWEAVMMLMDFALSSAPARLLHVCATVAVAVVYLTFTWVYYVAGGTDYEGNPYLYKSLDWGRRPWRALGVAALACFDVVVAWIFVWLLFKLRETVYDKWYREEASERDKELT